MLQFLPPEACVFKGTCYDETEPLRNYISSLRFAASLKLPFDSSTPKLFEVMRFALQKKETTCLNSSSFDPIFP